MQLPLVQLAEEGLIEDPHPSNVEATLPPIAKAVAMHERIEEQTKDASTQAQVSQRLLPSLTPSELLGLSGADLRHLSPEQYVLEQQHLLMPDPLQASLDEAAPEAETAAAAVDEWDKLMNLAATEQHPRLVGYVRQIVGDIPQISSLERFSVSEPQDEGCSEVFIEEGGGPEEDEPLFEIDLGAFELVDTGISAEELLTNEDPVIYHKDLPVHSVHHDTVQTEAAIHNLINAPQSMLTTQIPPTMVADNYCFAVDGDRIQMADILGDEHWWRHTSRPTKYFYSEDLRRFYRVNLLTVRGRIVSARLANTTPAMGGTNSAADMMAPELAAQQPGADFLPGASFSLPSTARRSLTFCTGSAGRPSFVMPSMDPAQYEPNSSSSAAASHQMGAAGSLSMFPPSGGPAFGRHSIAPIGFIQQQQQQQTTAAASALAGSQQQPQWQQPEMAQRGEQVHLGNVYRVVRFYSFWRTCTAFHRIVTMLERVGHSPGRSQSQKQLPSYSRQAAEGLPPSSAHSDSSSSAAAKSSSMVRPGSSSGGFGSGGGSRGAPPPPPDFQKRLFVQYLWRNIKPGDKVRVQREFDPRRQRLLKYVADSAARKRMTGAKMQQQQFGRSGSAGPSSSSGGGRAQRTPPLPPPAASCTSAAQSPSAQSARGSIRFRLPSDNRSLPPPGADSSRSSRPHSSPVSPMRRAKTAGEIGKPAAAGRSRDGGGGSRSQSRQATTRPASRADSGASSSRTTTEKSPRR